MKVSYSSVLLFITLSGVCSAQCANAGSGTSCNGPITVSPPSGNTSQSAIILTDLGSGTSAPAPSSGNYILSIIGGVIPESDNNGLYHTLVGPIGPGGLQGPAGPVGATGPQGPPGLQGSQGPAGPTGTQGASGAAATIGIGSTTTGASGTNATVTNVGTSSAALFNFAIPAGPAGAVGPTGPAGSKGVQGVAGAAGPAGATGPAGAIGPPGPAGPTGPTGQGVPAGGSSGAKLVKSSSADFATVWTNTFLNVQGPASAVTTSAGNDVVLYQYTLPANTMASNSVLRIYAAYHHANGSAGITYKLEIGSGVVTLATNSGKVKAYNETLIANLGALNSQAYLRGPSYSPGGVAEQASIGTFNVDTTVDEVIQLTANAASSSEDQVAPDFFAVELQ